jgi:hypothetical protein
VINNVIFFTEKGFSNRQKICVDYVFDYFSYSAVHAMEDARVYRRFWFYTLCYICRFNATAICISKIVSVSESCHIAVCHTIFKESSGFIKIYFLHGYLFYLLYRF